MDTRRIQGLLAEFAAERDWEQFHSPKNLAMALSVEAGELVEIFQWMTQEQSRSVRDDPTVKARAAAELADVQIYLLRLADQLEVDLETSVLNKIRENAEKYPVRLSKGNATKYDRRNS